MYIILSVQMYQRNVKFIIDDWNTTSYSSYNYQLFLHKIAPLCITIRNTAFKIKCTMSSVFTSVVYEMISNTDYIHFSPFKWFSWWVQIYKSFFVPPFHNPFSFFISNLFFSTIYSIQKWHFMWENYTFPDLPFEFSNIFNYEYILMSY